MDTQPHLRQSQGARIHQERHVVIHDLDDRVARVPTINFPAGVEDADQDLPGPALCQEIELANDDGREICRRFGQQVLGPYRASWRLLSRCPSAVLQDRHYSLRNGRNLPPGSY